MRKQKKILVQLLSFLIIILSTSTVFATDIANYIEEIEFSENYQQYLELSEEEKEEVIAPKMYDVSKDKMTITNPLKLGRMARSSTTSLYSLKSIIPANMVVKNQKQTNSCWTFSMLAALESNLALKDLKYQLPTIVYDFSERHMEYATSRTFADGVINVNGFNREVGDGGNNLLAVAYLTNGTGAIAEEEMEFENNEYKIDISEIQGKEVIAQVIDTIDFPSYDAAEVTTEIKQQMKDHITNYGGISALIYGASLGDTNCYNNQTGAIYCNDSSSYAINHAVTIVGWNDNYGVENFVEGNRPQNNGAWIIKNSWGTGEKYTLSEMKEYIYKTFPNECATNGWTDATQIPDDYATLQFSSWGYTIENNEAVLNVGDEGFMYVSYEDANIYQYLTGVVNAQSEVTYENIYQYDEYGGYLPLKFNNQNKLYLATVFNKKTTGTEYLTQVSINAPETYTCTVYVNPNGTSKVMSDLQKIELKAGSSETFDAGYHTIEFLEPLKINSDEFVVVLEVQGSQTSQISVMMEFNFGEYFTSSAYANAANHIYDNVTVQTDKCFMAFQSGMDSNSWYNTGNMYSLTGGKSPNFDTTIKAFTVSKILESISVEKESTKTSYVEGQDFDKTGMVVKANYDNGKTEEITDYTIQDGKNLILGQTTVTIAYEGKTTTQAIEVVENTVERIEIKTPSNKKEYWAGEDFDATGMVVEAIYKDGTRVEITEYTIQDGANLKNNQTTITIAYEDITTTQEVIVKTNVVEKIEIIQSPNKVKYIEGQNFDPTGMKVKATYANGTEKEVTGYTVQNGTNLQEQQTLVTIEFEGQTANQEITVEVKIVLSITIKSQPTKTEYIQNKEKLDLTGGIIEVLYNDNSKEEMVMTSDEIIVSGFDNQNPGTNTITLTYKEKTAQFNVTIKELAKPQNSNFSNMQGSVKAIKSYYFTDTNKKQYTVVDVELNNILKNGENDKLEYYYYLSSSQEETGIEDWVKIENLQNSNGKLTFQINTTDILNYEEVENSDVLYLYIKEVATKNDMQKQLITSSLLLEVENIKVEEYVDGEKKVEVNSNPQSGEKPDNTLASGIIPNAGTTILIICSLLVLLIIGVVIFLIYKDIEIK